MRLETRESTHSIHSILSSRLEGHTYSEKDFTCPECGESQWCVTDILPGGSAGTPYAREVFGGQWRAVLSCNSFCENILAFTIIHQLMDVEDINNLFTSYFGETKEQLESSCIPNPFGFKISHTEQAERGLPPTATITDDIWHLAINIQFGSAHREAQALDTLLNKNADKSRQSNSPFFAAVAGSLTEFLLETTIVPGRPEPVYHYEPRNVLAGELPYIFANTHFTRISEIYKDFANITIADKKLRVMSKLRVVFNKATREYQTP